MNDSPQSPTAGPTRRRLLQSAATVGGVAAASLALPSNVRKAMAATPPARGRLEDIEHVVLLMLENRSFDHYFGTLSGVRGFSDPNAMKLPGGRSVFHQPDALNPDGYALPFRLDTRTTSAQFLPDLSHAWGPQHQAWNNGAMDSWLPAHRAADGADGPLTMGYYTREDLPFHYALADAFTVLDGYHCSVIGPSAPNRIMAMSGTIDPNGEAGGPILETKADNGILTWKTYPERLIEAGVSLKVYHEPGHGAGPGAMAHFAQYNNAQPGSPLYDQVMATTPTGRFEYDAMNDKLPTVSVLWPPDTYSEHPSSLPAAGATYIASKIDAIAANPDVWAKTVFILSYDENDGFFDHVVPPTPKPGTADEFVTMNSPAGTVGGGLPVGLGYRVPAIIVSPWTTGGWVCSDTFDHTSQLRLLERITGVQEPNISQWRRNAVGDLTSAFRFNDADHTPPVLPDTNGRYNRAQYEIAQLPKPTVPTKQSMPQQEPGHRKRAK
jgi:phospholipase C